MEESKLKNILSIELKSLADGFIVGGKEVESFWVEEDFLLDGKNGLMIVPVTEMGRTKNDMDLKK